MSLRRQLMVGIAVVHALLMTLFIVDLVARQRQFLHQEQAQRGMSVARTIAANATSWVLSDDVVGLNESLSTFVGYPDLKYAFITNESGKVLAHTDKQLVGKFVTDPISTGVLAAEKTVRILIDDAALIDVAAPVLVQGRPIGWVRIGLSQESVQNAAGSVVRQGILYAALAVVAGIVLASLISAALTRRLSNLLTVAEAIRAGRRDRRAEEGPLDELGQLALSFNRMLDALIEGETELVQSASRLAALNDHLENRIHERTADLETMASQLAAARDTAETANKAKSAFLATMSHELRTPLTGIMGMLDLLKMNPTPAEIRQFIATLDISGKTLLTLIGDILDLSKIEAGELRLETIDFEIDGAIEQVFQLYNAMATKKGILLSLHRDHGVRSAVVRSDPTRLRQVLSNLISNAIKFTKTGSVDIRVTAPGGIRRARVWRFEVQDTGLGIEQAACAQLFMAFSQADASMTRRFGGTGLGLAICKRLVEALGGEIGAESEPGAGSTFWFTLPMEAGNPANLVPAESVAQPSAEPARPLRILIAEDSPVNQLIVVTLIERMGHRVSAVDNGLRAVEMAAAQGFDVIVMDNQMPEMDGPTATRTIRAMNGPNRHVPIIGLTADTLTENIEAFRLAGISEFLAKPIEFAVLKAAIERAAASIAQEELPARAGWCARRALPAEVRG